jgi:hypothetical protein
MNTIEERIRAAARAAADTVPPDGVPPLELPARRSRSLRVWGARRVWWARWLAPAAAAAAVVAITVAAVIVAGTGSPAPAGPTASPTAQVPSISAYVMSGQIPPYYITIGSATPQPSTGPGDAVVHDTLTGKALATIKPSVPGGAIMAASAAADDRTFILDEEPLTGSSHYQGPRDFYLMRLDAEGQPGPVSKLSMSVPQSRVLEGFAISPDGSKLALLSVPGVSKGNSELTVYDLATGLSRTWTGNGETGGGWDDPRSLSWTSDGRTLAFYLEASAPHESGVWVLNLTLGGSDLVADSRHVVSDTSPAPAPSHEGPPSCVMDAAIITPNGSAVVCGGVVLAGLANHEVKATGQGYLEFSTAAGKLVRVLGWEATGGPDPDPLWSSPSGSLLIGTGGSRGYIGVISGRTFTPLPGKMASGGVNQYCW